MKKRFSFLKNPQALNEIRKHKWIKSEKAKRDVGFVTAAIDWIKNHGEVWKEFYIKDRKKYLN